MNLKNSLGIETFPIREDEVTRRLCEAYCKGDTELILSSGNCTVKIGLDRISPEYLEYQM